MKSLVLIGVLSFPLLAQSPAASNATQAQGRQQFSAMDFGCSGDPAKDSTDCLRKLLAASSRKSVVVPPGEYKCDGDPFKSALPVDAAIVYAEGAVFHGCIFTSAGAKGGLTWTGGTFDTTSITGKGGPPVWQVSQDHTTFINTRFAFSTNYTAIQIGGGNKCPDDVTIEGIRTTANGQSHITPVCVSNLRINNWLLDGTGDEDGIAVMGLSGPSHDIAISNVTATNTYDILKVVNGNYPVYNVSLTNWTCTDCVTPIYLQGDVSKGISPKAFTNISVSHGTVIDLDGKKLTNVMYISSTAVPMNNVRLTDVQAFGRFNSTTHEAGWIRFYEAGGAVFDHFSFQDLTFVTPDGDKGSAPGAVVFGQNDVPWTNFQFRNVSSNGSTGSCLGLNGMQFRTQADLDISDNHFSGCSSANHAAPAFYINGRALWERNQTVLYPNQPELKSFSSKYPIGFSYAELSAPEYVGAAPGTTVYCYDCASTTPATPQSADAGGENCLRSPQGYWACGPYGPSLPKYENNAAALAAGLKPGAVYRTDSGVMMVVYQ